MPSHSEGLPVGKSSGHRALDTFKLWNRKGHYYLGLYFLFFLWLFAFTGLLLNHSWKFTEFWPDRKISKSEHQVKVPQTDSHIDRARGLMTQLGIEGEIEWTAMQADPTLFQFRVIRPGHTFYVTANPEQGHVVVERIEINTWGVMRVLHTFTGVRAGDDWNQREWWLTTMWVISMDVVSAGLIVMAFSGLYMWYGLPGKRKLGGVALMLGTAACALFVFGLRWIY